MSLVLGFGIRHGGTPRHPLFPRVAPTSARKAQGVCTALAGTFAELTEAARAGIQVRRAVFALNHGAAPFLTPGQRDELWQTFQVPVFALLLDAGGRLWGYECEAQNGLHLRRAVVPEAGLVVSAPCECGRPGNRLMVAPRIPQRSDRGCALGIPVALSGGA